jgi:hypothetical protein
VSRRREPGKDVSAIYVMVQIVCPEGHHVGKVVRQMGRDMLEHSLERVDGPNGETKVRAVCPTCTGLAAVNAERPPDTVAVWVAPTPQLRWDRIAALLDELEADPNRKKAEMVAR